MNRRLAILLSIAACSVAVAQSKLQKAPPALQKAIAASQKLRFTGTRMVEFKRGPDRVSHTEYVIVDGKNSRVEFPNDSPFAGQIIVERQGKRYHFFPDRNEIHVLPARREPSLARLGTMGRRQKGELQFSEDFGGEVAGKQTRLVVISDGNNNPLQRLWIVPQNGMILRRELLDPLGARMGMSEYRYINFSPRIAASDFAINRANVKVLTPLDLAKRAAAENGFLPVFIPSSEGYELEFTRVTKFKGTTGLAQMYKGKKVNLITLYQLKGEAPDDRRRGTKDTQLFAWQMRGRNFALVGKASAEELQRLARVLGAP